MPLPTLPNRYSFLSQPRAAGPGGAYYRTMGGAISDALRAQGDPNYSPIQSAESLANWGNQYRMGPSLTPDVVAQLPRAGQQQMAQAPVWAPTIMGAAGAAPDAQAAAVQTAAWQAAGAPQLANATLGTPTPMTSNLSLYRPQPQRAGATTPLGSSLPQLATPYQPQVQSASQTAAAAPVQSASQIAPAQSAVPPGMGLPQTVGPTTNVGAYGYNAPEMPATTLPGQTDQPPQEPSPYSLADIYGLKQDNPLVNATTWT